MANSHVDVPCLSFPVCKTDIILSSLPPCFKRVLGNDLSLPQNLNRTKCLCCLWHEGSPFEGFGSCYEISWETIFPDFSKQNQVGEVEAEKGMR